MLGHCYNVNSFLQNQDDILNYWASSHPLFGGFKFVPYMTALGQVNNLDDQAFNQLPPQPPKRKAPSPNKGKPKDKPPSQPEPSTGATSTSSLPEVSDKALHIASLQDHSPEEPGVWTEIMKLPGTKRTNQMVDGFVSWISKNYDAGIHEVNTYDFIFLLFVNLTNSV